MVVFGSWYILLQSLRENRYERVTFKINRMLFKYKPYNFLK